MGSAVRFPSGSGLRGEHRKGGTPASHVSQRATRRSDWEEVNPAWFLKLGLLKYNLHSVKCTRLGVYSDKCVQLCFYHHDQDLAHFRHPRSPLSTIYGQSLPCPWQPRLCFPSLRFCLVQSVTQIKPIVCSLLRLVSLIYHEATGREAGEPGTQRAKWTVAASGLRGARGPRRTGAAVCHSGNTRIYGRCDGSHRNTFSS